MKTLIVVALAIITSLLFANGVPPLQGPPIAEAVLPGDSGAAIPSPANHTFDAGEAVVSAPTNYDFENGTTGWLTGGTTAPGGPSGTGNSLSLNGGFDVTATSDAFTIDVSGTTWVYYINNFWRVRSLREAANTYRPGLGQRHPT